MMSIWGKQRRSNKMWQWNYCYPQICFVLVNNGISVFISRYFKISNSSSQGNADIIHVKAHVFQANKIVIVPNEHRDRDARRMRVMNVNRETTRGRHRLRFPSFDNPNNNPNTVSTSYHLTLRQF